MLSGKSNKVLTEVVIFIVGILIIYFGIYKGIYLLSSSGQELGEKKILLSDWERRVELVNSLKQKIEDMSLKEELSLAFPARKSTAELLASIHSAALKAGVSLFSFAPGEGGVIKESELAEGSASVSSYRVFLYNINLKVKGDYKQIYNFIGFLEKIKQVSRIQSISLSKGEGDIILGDINLVIYYLAK